MKTTKIIYWVSTAIVALMMVYSAYAYLTQQALEQAFQHLGYPQYFRIELAIAKVIGAALLLAPVGARIKEWTYAGFAFTFISAAIAHTVSGDPAMASVMPVTFLTLLAASYLTYNRIYKVSGYSSPAAK